MRPSASIDMGKVHILLENLESGLKTNILTNIFIIYFIDFRKSDRIRYLAVLIPRKTSLSRIKTGSAVSSDQTTVEMREGHDFNECHL